MKPLTERRIKSLAALAVSIRFITPYTRMHGDEMGGQWAKNEKGRYLRAMMYRVWAGEDFSFNNSADAAGISRGTVRSWLSRDPKFKAHAYAMREMWSISRIAKEMPRAFDEDFWLEIEGADALETFGGLEDELRVIASGRRPSDRFYDHAYPPGSELREGIEADEYCGVPMSPETIRDYDPDPWGLQQDAVG